MRDIHRIPSTILILTLLAFVPVLSLPAAELAGVTLEDRIEAHGQEWVLNGLGLRKVAIIKVYVAGLYLPEKSSDAAAILGADGPRHLVMNFLRGVSAKDLCDGWNDGLKNNTPDASDAVKRDFETLCGYMGDVEKDDQVVFTYLPANGTAVSVQGEEKGTIAGKDFADALFACWLGPKPPGKKFKAGILGG